MDEHHVALWANIPITQVGDLDFLDYMQLRRDAFIAGLMGTEAGDEYLADAWRLEQTGADKAKARQLFG